MPEYLRESLKTGHIISSLEGNAEKAVKVNILLTSIYTGTMEKTI